MITDLRAVARWLLRHPVALGALVAFDVVAWTLGALSIAGVL